MEKSALDIWVVYENPSDYPGLYVARKFRNEKSTAELVQGNTLLEVRALLPRGLVRLPRQHLDDPVIVETWI